MKSNIGTALLMAISGLILIFGQAIAAEQFVNCDRGNSIQKAIDAGAGSAARKVIHVTGFCEEDLLITRDNISLLGDGNTMISGRIGVRGSDGLTIRDLSITGPGDGISASVSRIFMTNVHIVGNYGDGIALRWGGAISLRDGSITGNLGDIGFLIENGHGQLINTEVSGNAHDGIVVNVNGNLTMIGGAVKSHENGTGIVATKSSTVELEGVDVRDNVFGGVNLSMGSAAAIYNSQLNASEHTGIILRQNSSAEIGGQSTVADNDLYGALVSSHSVLTLTDETQVYWNDAHGIVVEHDGGLFATEDTRVFDNWAGDGVQIECRDKESSILLDGPVVSDPSTDINCPDPDF